MLSLFFSHLRKTWFLNRITLFCEHYNQGKKKGTEKNATKKCTVMQKIPKNGNFTHCAKFFFLLDSLTLYHFLGLVFWGEKGKKVRFFVLDHKFNGNFF